MLRSALLAAAFLVFAGARADAQFVYVAGYAPAPVVVAPTPVVAYRPVVPVTAYSPVVATPVAVPVAVPVAAPVVTTRYRPILGGTVTRVRYRYAPTFIAY